MSPVTLVLIVPLVWECSFPWSGFLVHTFLIPVEVLVLSRLSKRKIQNWAAPKTGEGLSPPPPDELSKTRHSTDGEILLWEGDSENFPGQAYILACFLLNPPFGNGFWLQDLQAMEQSIIKLYKFRKAIREVSAVCKQTVVNLDFYFNYVKVE